MAEKRTFESSIKRIEEIVGLLEKGDTPLENSLSLYEEAMKLMKECGTVLDRAEQKVTMLTSDKEENPKEKTFDTTKSDL